MPIGKRAVAEFLGTFWLVFGGCGSAVLAAKFLASDNANINLGIGLVGVSFAFGLTVLTMAYAIGHISGCHLNPAVTVGLAVARRFPTAEVIPYVLAQVAGAVVGAGVLYLVASGRAGFDLAHELRVDDVERAGFGGEYIGAFDLADHERAHTQGIAHADQLLACESDQGVGAFDLL